MDKLKACPFCGGKAVPFIPGDAPDSEPPHWITCEDCEADGPHYQACDDVIAAWNRRTAPDGCEHKWKRLCPTADWCERCGCYRSISRMTTGKWIEHEGGGASAELEERYILHEPEPPTTPKGSGSEVEAGDA